VDEPTGAPRHITGVATDMAGFVGVTEHGPAAPTLVTSWAQFQQTFGSFIDRAPFVTPYWRLPYAVRGFFENGGTRLYVARVLDAMAPAATGDLDGVVGDSAAPTGIAALIAIADISLMAVPDDVVDAGFGEALLDRCHEARNRMAIVNVASAAAGPGTLTPHRDTAFGARYYPQLHVPAPHRPLGYAVVPPCGHVAGGLAQTDTNARAHHAAAELADGGLITDGHASGVEPLALVVRAAESDQLVARGVNVIRNFRPAGRGVVVWSGRTMSSDPEWKYVQVRRLLTYVEHSIDRGAQWVVFEPNREPTWAAVRASISDFLVARWRDGALAGTTANQAFFVKCDRSTMTQDDIDNGRLVCLVGVAPLRPAEFVIVRIGQWTADRRR